MEKFTTAYGLKNKESGELYSEAHFYRKEAKKRAEEIYAHTTSTKPLIIKVVISEVKYC